MSDSEEVIEFKLQREVESSVSSDASSMEYDQDYEQRVELLRKKHIQDNPSVNLVKEEPADLQNLQQKIKRKQQQSKNDKKKKKKKSFVQSSYLKTIVMMSITRLYQYQQKIQDYQHLVLSYFTYEEVTLMEEKISQNKFQDQLLALFTQFQNKFHLKKSEGQPRTSYQQQLYPDEYITHLGALLSVFNIKVRVIMGVDLAFTELEDKFKVKAIEKEIKIKQIRKDIVLLGDDIVQPVMEDKLIKKLFNKSSNKFMTDEYQQSESLDQFQFAKKKQNNSVSMTQIQLPLIQKLEVQSENKDEHALNMKGQLFQSNNNIWLEIYNDNQWLPFDPISDQLCTCDIQFIQRKLHKTCSFYIFGTQNIDFQDDFLTYLLQSDRHYQNIYFIDLSWKYLLSYKMIRVRLQLEKWFNTFAKQERLIYFGLTNFLKDAQYIQSDQSEFINYQKLFIPTNEKDYKYHSIYALPSQLNQYSMIHPSGQPCSFKSKDEQVYLKSDVIILHSKDRWRDQLLEVKQDELPFKEVSGRFDKTKMTALYAEWQCEPLKISLNEFNGELPKNPYLNFDLNIHPPPIGTIMFPKLGFKRVLQKSGIPFVESVNGFEVKNGKMVVIKCGYLIYINDYERVQQIYETHIEDMRSRNKLNKLKQLQKLWSDLFKVILVKKQITDQYNQK